MQHNDILDHHCFFELHLAIRSVFWHQVHNLDVYAGHIVDNHRSHRDTGSVVLDIEELETLEKRDSEANRHQEQIGI